MEWCIRQLSPSSVISFNIISIAHNLILISALKHPYSYSHLYLYLDVTSVCFSMSNHMLLGLRDGLPALSVRTISNTGHLYSNRQVRAYFAVKTHDNMTGENYGKTVSFEFPQLDLVHVS